MKEGLRERIITLPGRHKRLSILGSAFLSISIAACNGASAPTPRPSEGNPSQNPLATDVLGANIQPENFYLGDSDTTGQVLGAKTGPMDQLLNIFISDKKDTAPDYDKHFGPQCEDLVNYWSKFLGGKQFQGLHSSDIFGQYKEFYTSIPYTGNNEPQTGDIMDWKSATWNGGDGHTAIVEKVNSDGSVVVWEENGAGGVNVQEHTYTLNSDVEGWLRVKNSEQVPSNPSDIDSYFTIDGKEPEIQGGILGEKFWWDMWVTTKLKPQLDESGLPDSANFYQATLNSPDFLSQIPTLLNFTEVNQYIYNGGTADGTLDLTFVEKEIITNTTPALSGFPVTRSGDLKEVEIQIQDLTSNMSPRPINDLANKNGLTENIAIVNSYTYRTRACHTNVDLSAKQTKGFMEAQVPPISGEFTLWQNGSDNTWASQTNGEWKSGLVLNAFDFSGDNFPTDPTIQPPAMTHVFYWDTDNAPSC